MHYYSKKNRHVSLGMNGRNATMEKGLIGSDLKLAIAALQKGELVGIPTETVYGLAANALDESAVTRIFTAKNRPTFDPLIVHIRSKEDLIHWTKDLDERALNLASTCWPGPLTLLLTKKRIIPDLVTSGSPLVGIRVPNHPLTLELLQSLSFPLAAPSANPFGYISPTTAQHVADQLGEKVSYVLDGGACQVGLESTIIGFEGAEAIIYRKGGLPVEEIEAIIGKVTIRAHSSSNPKAPGMLKSHYAPLTPFILGNIQSIPQDAEKLKIGIISFKEGVEGVPENQQVILSANGDMEEAARNLFSGMRHLDNLGLQVIIAELLPEKGLGRAINDRLRRAAA